MSVCQHIMKSGKNKGKHCEERTHFATSTNFTQTGMKHISYCFKHMNVYEAEWRPKLEEDAKNEVQQKLGERLQFESKLEDREFDYQKINDILKSGQYDSL